MDLNTFYHLPPDGFTLIDIRSASERAYGFIPGSVHIPLEDLPAGLPKDPGHMLILYCQKGVQSVPAAEELAAQGFAAHSLDGGYLRWLQEEMRRRQEAEDAEAYRRKVEQSLRKKFKRELQSPFLRALKQYQLVQNGDRVAVCISGGKDSMLMAKLFQEVLRHSEVDFTAEFLVMDPGYNRENRQIIEQNARLLGIPIHIFETDIFEAVYTIEKSPCYLCARMRRGYLYRFAQELGCNKIALGHHYDDVIETVLMGMLYGAQFKGMMPKLHSTNFPGMELIRPLYLVREDDIKAWRDYNGLHFIQCACKFTDTCTTCDSEGRSSSKRLEIKNLIRDLKEKNPDVEKCIFASMENVHIDTVLAYKKDGVKHSFLEEYDG